MTPHESDIADMQCWLVRMAETKWGVPAAEVSRIFMENDVFGFISELYDLLHVSSYECALRDVEDYLRNRGVKSLVFEGSESCAF